MPPIASPHLCNHGLEVCIIISLQVHFQTHSIIILKCRSKVAQSQPPSEFLNPFNHWLHVNHTVRLMMKPNRSSVITQLGSPDSL